MSAGNSAYQSSISSRKRIAIGNEAEAHIFLRFTGSLRMSRGMILREPSAFAMAVVAYASPPPATSKDVRQVRR
jgi:hypothetical protein